MFSDPPADARALITRMADQLTPRGPDGGGDYLAPPIALGHRRLSIIDAAGGGQPMASADGRYHLVCNGELYNYLELRRLLEAGGHRFTTQSDTEVLLAQLAQGPIEALSRLNGMFALALWDDTQKELLLARDRLGIKPLYYCMPANDLVFASELKALLQHPGVRKSINPAALNKYFAYGYIPAPATIYHGIYKLEPGQYLVHGPRGAKKAFYWDIPPHRQAGPEYTFDEYARQLQDRLRQAVKMQLRSDVPVGVFLSGGIDSSTITALAAQESGPALHTFSVGFAEPSYDETPYALAVARRYGTVHHHEVLSARDAGELLPLVFRGLDEPLGDASILPTFFLSRFTRRTVKVALGGDGGDELFFGYPAFQAHYLMEGLARLPARARAGLAGLARRLPGSERYAGAAYLLRLFCDGFGLAPEIRFFIWMGADGNAARHKLFSHGLRETLGADDPFEDLARYNAQGGRQDMAARLQYLCMKLYLQDGVLAKVDRASMAHALEVRAPFLDHTLVEFAAGIPARHVFSRWQTKRLLKRAVRDLLPERIIARRKAGFMIPLAGWLAKPLQPLVREMCSPAALAKDAFFDPAVVQQMLLEHHAGQCDHRKRIWSLLAFQFWRQYHGS